LEEESYFLDLVLHQYGNHIKIFTNPIVLIEYKKYKIKLLILIGFLSEGGVLIEYICELAVMPS
jgi:hypothetical protein